MTSYQILTDSSAQLTSEEIQKYKIQIIPLSLQIAGEVIGDTQSMDPLKYLDVMDESSQLPTTSQPSVGAFVEQFKKMGERIIFVGLSEKLSGTIGAAKMAAEMLDVEIEIIDARTADRGLAYQVIRAAQLTQQGQSIAVIRAELAEILEKTSTYVYIDKLDNLVKGGRLSVLSGRLSHLLNIKVIVKVVDGELSVVKKGRGKKFFDQFQAEMFRQMKTLKLQEISISHAGAAHRALSFEQEASTELRDVPIIIHPLGPVLSTHAGRGAFALSYLEA